MGFRPGHVVTQETREKISRAKKGNVVVSPETREKLRKSLTGRKLSSEHRHRMSVARTGYRLSQATRDKISKAHLKTGRFISKGGYVYVYSPGHPNAVKGKYVAEHRLVMERWIGRFLLRDEVVHHCNGDPSDNRIENLVLVSGHAEHKKLHRGSPSRVFSLATARKIRKLRASGVGSRELSRLYGVSIWCIMRLCRGASYKEIM